MELNNEVKAIVQQMGAQMQRVVSNDPELNALCDQLKEQGVQAVIALSANISLVDTSTPVTLEDLAEMGMVPPLPPPMMGHSPFMHHPPTLPTHMQTPQKSADLRPDEITFDQSDRDFLKDLQIRISPSTTVNRS